MDEASETVFKLLRRSKTLSSAQLTRFFDAVRGASNEELLRQFKPAKKKKTASAKTKKATNPAYGQLAAVAKKSGFRNPDFIALILDEVRSRSLAPGLKPTKAQQSNLPSLFTALQRHMSDETIVEVATRVAQEHSFNYDAA